MSQLLAGFASLTQIDRLCASGRISATTAFALIPPCVRGLEYYTGPVFEAEITIAVVNEDGQTVRFGSVGGGGRYDGLVERFPGTKVPATGFSIGVSRLQAALAALNKDKPAASDGPVVVLVMEKDRLADYQKMAQSLRHAGIRAEMYLGTAGMKAQMKYADKRGAPCVVIQGGDERKPRARCRSRIWSKAPRPPPPSRTARNGAKAARRRSRCPKPTSSPPCAKSSRGTGVEPMPQDAPVVGWVKRSADPTQTHSYLAVLGLRCRSTQPTRSPAPRARTVIPELRVSAISGTRSREVRTETVILGSRADARGRDDR